MSPERLRTILFAVYRALVAVVLFAMGVWSWWISVRYMLGIFEDPSVALFASILGAGCFWAFLLITKRR
jgi:uncharacterized MnhB-related membrane protein